MSIKRDIINKYADTFEAIEPFGKNTLSYVGIAFQFDTVVDFDKKQPDFYSKIKSQLPYKMENSASEGSLMLTISPEVNQFGFNQKSESYTEYVYSDNKEKPTIRVITNRKKIDFQCIDPQENYKSFKDFLEKIFPIFTAFCNLYYGKINLMEIVLRKINKIEYDINAEKYLNKTLLYELEVFDTPFSNTSSYKEFSTIGDTEEVIEFRSGIIKNSPESDKYMIIYDYTVKQDNPNKLTLDRDFVQGMLKDFSKKIYNLYCFCVGDDYIENVLKNE